MENQEVDLFEVCGESSYKSAKISVS